MPLILKDAQLQYYVTLSHLEMRNISVRNVFFLP